MAKKRVTMDEDLTQLERDLMSVKRPVLKSEVKNRIRRSLFVHIKTPIASDVKYSSLEKLKNYIGKVAYVTEPSSIFKARVKENVLAVIKTRNYGSGFILAFNRNFVKVLSGFLIALFSFSSIAVYFSDIPVTRAAKKTLFQSLYGDVEVVRAGQFVKASKNMQLLEGDIIATGEDGFAVIRYFDDSISRLSPLTELRMQRLYQNRDVMSDTKVKVELTCGHVWNQVVNLVGEKSSFEMIANDVETKVSEKASFDVSYVKREKKVAVSVFENKVEVNIPKKRKANKEIIAEGHVLEVKNNKSEQKRIKIKTKEDKLWVNVNKSEDKEYKRKVNEEKAKESKEVAGILPADPLYPAKRINESTKLLMTVNPTEKNKIKVDIAVKRLIEATTLLSKGNKKEADAVLDEFSGIVDEISIEIASNHELRDYINSSFADEEKNLSTVLPDNSCYGAKEALREAKLKLAVTDRDKEKVALKSAAEKVVEAKELFQDEKQGHTQGTLLKTSTEIVTVSSDNAATDDPEIVDDEKIEAKGSVKTTIGVAEEALKSGMDNVFESDSAVIVIMDTPRVQLKEVRE